MATKVLSYHFFFNILRGFRCKKNKPVFSPYFLFDEFMIEFIFKYKQLPNNK